MENEYKLYTGDKFLDMVLYEMYKRLDDTNKKKLVGIMSYIKECNDANQITFSENDKKYLLLEIEKLKLEEKNEQERV